MLLTEEGIETLMGRVGQSLAQNPDAHAILVLNHRPTSPARVSEAIASCEVTMTRDDLYIRANPDARHFLYPLGGMIADAINAELGVCCGFIM